MAFRTVLVRGAVTLVVAIFVVLATAVPAQSHGFLVRSDPASGVTLAEPPALVRLWFNEAVSSRVSTARLVDAAGRTVHGSRVTPPGGDHRRFELAVPRLGSGSYGVLWRVLTEDDGHWAAGTLVFSVGTASARQPVLAGGSSSTVDVALRWLRLCLLAGLVGALATLGVLGRAGATDPAARPARRRLLVLALGCAALAAQAGLVELVGGARQLRTSASGFWSTQGELLFDTRWGHLWLAREAALLALVPLLAAALSGRRRRAYLVAAGSAALAVIVVEALGSHAASVPSGRVLAVTADAAHVLAACLWLGVLPALALLLARDTRPLVRACLPYLARLVAASVALLVITGLYGAGRQVESVDDLVTTPYGRTLLVKAGLLAVLLALGLANATRRSPRRRLVIAEAATGAVLLLAVGVLAETPPARGPDTAAVAGDVATRSGSVGDLVVTISATPNRPGLNGFTVIAASTRRPPPAPVDSARLEFAAGGTTSVVALREVGPQRYFATTRLDAAGPVEISAVLQRAGTSVQVPVSWALSRPAIPVRPLAPYVDGAALGLLGIAALTGAAYALRRRRAGQ